MTLLSGFMMLLHRYSHQQDLVIAHPVAGRTHPDLESLIGFFVNTLAMRFSVDPEMTFFDLLAHSQTVALDAFEHQDIPLDKLLDALALERDPSYLPLCQVMFVLQNAPFEPPSLPNLILEPLDVHSGVARFDLTLSIQDEGDRLQAEWEYNQDLFDASTITQMAVHFERLLALALAQPTLAITDLPLVSIAEQQQQLASAQWGELRPEPCCIHQVIEAQVVKTPTMIALKPPQPP